tara:strand:- start:793 stop:945 length:153 start_codon:yes stop_codon:yes gene_type:complete
MKLIFNSMKTSKIVRDWPGKEPKEGINTATTRKLTVYLAFIYVAELRVGI